jgi:hypothetical protein
MSRMDPHEKDETAFRRQEALARRIGRALDQMDSRSTAACPDGEILAAYAERGLNLEETAKWEGHFSTCSRCRKILRVLDASTDTPLAEKEVARLGEMVAAAMPGREGARTPSRLAWPRFSDWRMRWLAPALGVAAVLLVFLVLRKNWRGAGHAQTPVLVALAPKQELPASSPLSQGAPPSTAARPEQPQALRAQQADRLSPPNGLNTVPSNSAADESAKRKAKAAAPSPGVSARAEAGGALQADKRLGATQAEREEIPSASPPAPSVAENQTEGKAPSPAAPPPPVKAAPNMAATQTVQLDASANAPSNTAPNTKQTAAGQAQPAPSAGGAPARAQASSEAAMAAKKKQVFALVAPFQQDSALLKAPLGSTVWRAGTAGKIERSADGGVTWTTQPSPSQEDWLAGSAVSGSVCWLVGRHGAIARTIDGEHWDSVAPPLAAVANGAMPDWTGIAATDAQNATITAGDGRRFTTSDGGRSWRQPPQK